MKKYNTCQFVPAYPNEANPSYFRDKLMDAVTSAVTGMGVIAIIFFLFTL
jgi:hypothetical protein